MTTQVRNQRRWRIVHKPLALLPILIALFSLALLAHVKSGQDEKRGARDITHVQIVIGKKNAWLNRHPVLLKVSQISFGGMPGSFLTDTCWLLIKTVSHHPHPRTPDSQQTT